MYEMPDDPAPDFDEDEQWLDDNVKAAVENLQEILYDAGVTVTRLEIMVPRLPGQPANWQSDYGRINIYEDEL